MANPNLASLKSMLLAMDAAVVTEPDIPVPTEIQEASDLRELTRDPKAANALIAVGLPADSFDKLEVATDATRAAQSEWTVTRDRTKSDAQVKLKEQGYAFRTATLAACRWSLRKDRVAMGTLSAIAEGEGVEDLVQDLADLAELMERRAPAFAADTTFDVAAKVQQARELSKKIGEGLSATRLTTEQAEAKGLRDRAYTYLHSLVSEIREAGRYAFTNDPSLARKFASAYRRRHRNNTPASPTLPPVPTDA